MDPNEPINQPDPSMSPEPVNPPTLPVMDVTTEPIEPIAQPEQTPVMPPAAMQPEMPVETPMAMPPEPETPTPPVTPIVPIETPPEMAPAPKSSKKLLIIVSIIVILLLAAGAVAAFFLLNKEEEKKSITNKPPTTTTNPNKPTGDDTDDGENETTGKEKVLKCMATMTVGSNAVNMGMLLYFDKQGTASKMIYEYIRPDGTVLTQEVLAQMKSGVEQQFAATKITGLKIVGELTPDGGAKLTITDESGDKITLTKFGYGGNSYAAGKVSMERECAALDGMFDAE